MADVVGFEQLWERWQTLNNEDPPSAAELTALKDDIYDGLGSASGREERKSLAELLALVQNRVYSLASKKVTDPLTAALNEVGEHQLVPILED